MGSGLGDRGVGLAGQGEDMESPENRLEEVRWVTVPVKRRSLLSSLGGVTIL